MSRYRLRVWFGLLMLITLFAGYVLTTGLTISESVLAKWGGRVVSVALGVSALLVRGRLRLSRVVAVALALMLFAFNQNPLAFNLAFLVFIVICLEGIRDKHIASIVLIAVTVGVAIHLFAILNGAVNIAAVEVGERVRYTLGFSNANQLALVYFSLSVSAGYLHLQYRTGWSLGVFAASALLALSVIYVSDSRTFLLAWGLFLTWAVFGRFRWTMSATQWATIIMPFAGIAATFAVTWQNNTIYNDLLSNRPMFFSEFVANKSVHEYLLGWRYPADTAIDNAYLLLGSSIGLPLAFVVLLAVAASARRLTHIQRVVVAVLLVAAATESFLIRPEIPLAILFAWLLLAGPSHRPKCIKCRIHSVRASGSDSTVLR